MTLGGLSVCALALGLAYAMPHPLAPWAMFWGDAALGSGSTVEALAHYEVACERNPLAGVRRAAHRRAALIHSTQFNDPTSARRHLEAVLASTGDAARRAALLENIGELLLQEGLAEGAAARFEAAADAATDPVIAGRQRLRAARVLVDDDRYKAAEALFRRVSRDVPALTGEAELGRAELRLREGKVEQALGLFERAAQHTFDPDLASVARLGRTVCLERLGDLESALAELEQDDMLPEEIAEERAGQLRSRRQPR